MRIKYALLASCLLAGCAKQPDLRAACAHPPGVVVRADYCRYPADVRAFLDDRDLCDHFRGEPWPESDSDEDRDRRRQLLDGMRTHCAGTDRRLEALRVRYRDDAGIQAVLSVFERGIETGNQP